LASCWECLEGEGSALDLLAVASGVELLEVSLVLAGDEGIGEPEKLKNKNCLEKTFFHFILQKDVLQSFPVKKRES
jgi:hypothetical protein